MTGARIEEPTEVPPDLTDGEPVAAPEGLDPVQLSRDTFDRLVAQGATSDVAAAEAFSVIARAGLAGDKRVIVDEDWSGSHPFGPQR